MTKLVTEVSTAIRKATLFSVRAKLQPEWQRQHGQKEEEHQDQARHAVAQAEHEFRHEQIVRRGHRDGRSGQQFHEQDAAEVLVAQGRDKRLQAEALRLSLVAPDRIVGHETAGQESREGKREQENPAHDRDLAKTVDPRPCQTQNGRNGEQEQHGQGTDDLSPLEQARAIVIVHGDGGHPGRPRGL